MRSLPLLPLELEAAVVEPSLSILELGPSLSLPHWALPGIVRGVDLFCCSIVSMLAAGVPPRVI